MITEMKNILYASDIEDDAHPAFRAAIRLCICGQFKSRITFLNVIEPLSSSAQSLVDTMMNDDSLQEMHEQSLQNLRQKITQRIEAFCKKECDKSKILSGGQVIPRIEEGIAWKVIIDIAKEIDADVIVMGTRRHSSIGQFLLGSTANKVMHLSKIPVLVVPLP